MNEAFRHVAAKVAAAVGSAWAFLTALLIIIVWGTTGPLFHFSDTWQLVINTGTTIVTFLMVFLIQNTQNREARAIHLKLDELIRAMQGARNNLIALEDLSDEALEKLHEEFEHMSDQGHPAGQQVHVIRREIDGRRPRASKGPDGLPAD